jgi:hypothetical protein
MTDSILCTVEQVEAILVFLQGQRLQLKSVQLTRDDGGSTPTSQNVRGVLIWNGLKRYTHGGFSKLEKKFWKKVWMV